MSSRKEKILDMLKDEPNDSFLRYSLAMELEKEGNNEESLKVFGELMESDPPHVASFFMAAQQLNKLDRAEEAKPILQRGIAEASKQGDQHAAMEMTGFLDMLD